MVVWPQMSSQVGVNDVNPTQFGWYGRYGRWAWQVRLSLRGLYVQELLGLITQALAFHLAANAVAP